MSLRGTAKPGQYLTGKINKVTFQIITAYGVAVKNGFKGTEEEWLASLQANPDLVEQFVNEYLDENPVVTDTSLSISGRAADSKATGDAIHDLKITVRDHAISTENPHGVTKSQVGLGNVDNTSDMDKPVSTAQATAIADAKKAGTDAQTTANAAIPKAGGTMTGTLDMGYHYITRLSANPQNDHDAVRKDYVDRAVAGAKTYADGKRLYGTVTLTTTWTDGVQEVTEGLSGILATDMPHWGVVYGTNEEAEKEAFALVDVLETSAGKFTFRCFGDVPTVALTIQWEVNR